MILYPKWVESLGQKSMKEVREVLLIIPKITNKQTTTYEICCPVTWPIIFNLVVLIYDVARLVLALKLLLVIFIWLGGGVHLGF